MTTELDPIYVHQEVRRVWAEHLDVAVDEVQAESNFFLDGGDSLTAVELVVTLGERFGIDVALDPLFIHGTVEALVESVLADACRPSA